MEIIDFFGVAKLIYDQRRRNMKIKAKYPSGAIKRFDGTWLGFVKVYKEVEGRKVVDLREMCCSGVRLRKNTIAWIDPRAICFNEKTGKVLYNPRKHISVMKDEFKEWMEEHKEWPHREDLLD